MSYTEDSLGLWPRYPSRPLASVQSNLHSTTALWKSVSYDCLPQLAHTRSRDAQSESVNQSQSSAGYFTSLYSSGPPRRGHLVSKLDERTLEINENTPSGIGRLSYNSSHLSLQSTKQYIREPSHCIARETNRSVRFSETNLPCSLTLDSFMDIESINDEPLETDYSSASSKPNPSRGSTSSKALWQSLTTNASTLISSFEPRTKHSSSSLEQRTCSLPSSPTQNKGRAFFNLKFTSVRNHKKSFSLPPSSQLEPEPRLLSQPISRIPGKKVPALHKRVSAIFRGGPSNWNQIHYSIGNEQSPRSRTNQELSPGITPGPFTYFDSTITPILKTQSASSSVPNFRFRSHSGEIITPNLVETSMSTSSSLLKNKPLPDIPVEQVVSDVYEETGSEDKATTSSCSGSVIDCFTMLNAQWPEPPRHMMFLDPGMAEMWRRSHHVGNKGLLGLDISPTTKKSPLKKAIYTQDFKESLKRLLASVEIFLNGSQISSQSPLPSTLVFPTTTASGSSRPNDTIQLTIRAPTRSLLISFCTVYADTTLTFEEQTVNRRM